MMMMVGAGLLCVSANAFAFGKTVSVEALQDKTAFALGLEDDEFDITDVRKEGISTHYKVKAKSVAQYRCYVTAVLFTPASDAVCSKKGEAATNPLLEAARARQEGAGQKKQED